MENKTLSIRMVKMKSNTGTKQSSKYYKSYKEQMEHDFRIENIEKNYLKRPNEKNEYYKFKGKNLNDIKLNDIENLWDNIKKYHLKHKKRKLDKQTKPTINFLLSFSKDFDLSIEDRKKQMESVKNYISKNYSLPIYLVQHNDEKALHYSFSIMNYDFETQRPLAKQINTSQLQDNIAEHLKKDNQDYGHSRGIKKNISLKEHKSIMEGKVEELNKINKELVLKNQELHQKYNDMKTKHLGTIKLHNEEMKQSIEELEIILSDFIDLNLNYKGKNIQNLYILFQRYLKKEENLIKFETLKKKIENLVNKGKKKRTTYNK